MPRPKLPPFTCPRCAYNTERRDTFSRHLDRVVICPAVNYDVVLTPEIKAKLLNNRVYKHVAAPPVPTYNQNFTNNNTMNNFIAGLDTIPKLQQLTEYRQKDVIDFETKVETLYEKDVERFKRDSFRGGNVEFNQTHYIEMIHDMAHAEKNDLEDMCLVYSKDDDRLYISQGAGEWDNLNKDRGVLYIIETLVSCRLEFYERYLIRKMESRKDLAGQMALKECLEEYYRFIATFNVKPCVVGKCDNQIMYNDDETGYESDNDAGNANAHRIVDKYFALYHRISTAMSESTRKALLKSVVDALKMSTKTNLKELNKRVMAILKVDEGFKNTLLAM